MENQNDISAAFNSPAIEKQLVELKNRKEKNAFLESIMTHPSAVVLNETNGHKTILFAGNKGPKTITWKQTKQMACELNRHGYDVASELEHGFKQAGVIILKLKKYDSGLFKKTLDYLLRNNIPYGNILLINKYGEKLELLKKDIRTGIYKRKIRGFF